MDVLRLVICREVLIAATGFSFLLLSALISYLPFIEKKGRFLGQSLEMNLVFAVIGLCIVTLSLLPFDKYLKCRVLCGFLLSVMLGLIL